MNKKKNKRRTGTTVGKSLTAREANAEIRRLLAGHAPEISRRMAAARRKLRARIPCGFELLYDNYNGVGIGYGATQKFSAPVVSLFAFPRWVTLFFLYGATIDDPHTLLEGSGSRVRSIRLESADLLDDPRIGALLEKAMRRDEAAFAAAPPLRTYLQSVARVRRSRAPGGAAERADSPVRSPRMATAAADDGQCAPVPVGSRSRLD